MASSYRIDDQEGLYYVTWTIVQWIDIFTRQVYRDIVVDSLRYCQEKKGLKIYGWVIMSNHVHAIVSSDKEPLSGITRDCKRHTSKAIVEVVKTDAESRRTWLLNQFKFNASQHTRNEEYQVWMQKNHPVELITQDFIIQKLDYIHNNPVRAGLVYSPEDYVYSSASSYAGKESLLEIVHLY